MGKEQDLTKLYGIRAGLSVLSVEKDAVVETKETMEMRKKGLRISEQNIPQRITSTQEQIKEIEQKIIWKNCCGEKKYSFFEHFLFPFLAGLGILLLIFLPTALILVAVFVDALKGVWAWEELLWLAGILGLIFEIGYTIYAIIDGDSPFAVFEFVDFGWDGIISPREIKKENERVQEEISEWKRQKESLLEKISVYSQNLEQERKDCKLFQQQSRELVAQKVNSCALFYQAFAEEYGKYLDERDWQHVDLLIFYFETGRADTLKEGLQLVDRQVQTNSIIQAIRTASAEISRTIQIGMGRIERMIGEGFSLLSTQIGELQKTQNLQLIKLDNLANNQKISMAIQSRAHVNSVQLMEDVRYMRTLTENAEVRRRNNI